MANFEISIGMSEQTKVAGKSWRQHFSLFFIIIFFDSAAAASLWKFHDLNFIMSIRQSSVIDCPVLKSLPPIAMFYFHSKTENCNFAWFMWCSISTLITSEREDNGLRICLQLFVKFYKRKLSNCIFLFRTLKISSKAFHNCLCYRLPTQKTKTHDTTPNTELWKAPLCIILCLIKLFLLSCANETSMAFSYSHSNIFWLFMYVELGLFALLLILLLHRIGKFIFVS